MIWLVPLAVLARPRVWPYVLWQLAEVAYFFGIWGYFVNMYQPPAGVHRWLVLRHARRPAADGRPAGRTMVLDMLHPERDRVRASGLNDDPAGGVLDGAPDRLVIVWGRANRNASEPAEATNLEIEAPVGLDDPQAKQSRSSGSLSSVGSCAYTRLCMPCNSGPGSMPKRVVMASLA